MFFDLRLCRALFPGAVVYRWQGVLQLRFDAGNTLAQIRQLPVDAANRCKNRELQGEMEAEHGQVRSFHFRSIARLMKGKMPSFLRKFWS